MLRMLANCLILLLIPVSLTFAQDRKPAYLKAYERGGFAAIEDPVQFRDAHAFPPQLKGLTVDSGAKVDFRVTDNTDFEKRLTITTALALRDVRVKAAVGNRFATLGGGSIEPEKDAGGVDKGDTAVDFYNYDENRAYRAVLVGDRVVSVRAWPKGFQPKETRAEVQAAANIVAKDPAHARAVTGLEARGLRAPSERGDRLLYLLFYRGKERPAVYEATVNMSAGRVVRAEPIRN